MIRSTPSVIEATSTIRGFVDFFIVPVYQSAQTHARALRLASDLHASLVLHLG